MSRAASTSIVLYKNVCSKPILSRKKVDTGLGLSIAAQIVNNHGGKLEFQTQPSEGTTFAIVLPAQQDPS